MKLAQRIGTVSALLAAFAFGNAAIVGANAAGMETETKLLFFADESVVKDGAAVLTRLKNGVAMRLSTVNLEPKDAVTIWWVVFDEPTKCSDECNENDIFNLDADGEFILNDDGSPPINGAGVEAAQITVIRADGHVVDESGAAQFSSRLPIGDVSEALFGGGLQNPMTATIHLIVRTHGPAIPGKLDSMLYTVNGGCEGAFPNPPCADVQFAIFEPPAN